MGKRKAVVMEHVESPLAKKPAKPKALVAHLELRLGDCNKELLEHQAATRQIQEVYGSARRQTNVLLAALLAGDEGTAAKTLQLLEQVPAPQQVVGEVWSKEARARFADSGEFSNFTEGYLTCLQIKSFLDSGVLTVSWPEAFRSGIDNIDDERYLLSLVSAVKELERFAVGRARVLDLQSIRIAWTTSQCVEQAMLQFDFRNSVLRHRYDSVKYVVKRLETLVYEVDLAVQRHCALQGGAQAEAPAASTEPPEPKQDAISLDLLNGIKVIKRSRDVGKGAKNAVYALQREDFKKADQILSQCAKEAEAIFKEHVLAAPTLRGGGFSAALEELAEAVSYRSFRKDRKLLNKAELQTATDLNFELTLPEYLGGILDLTGEVGRLAVRQASRGREAVHEVELCLACVEGVCCGIQELVYLPGVGKKMFAAKATLLKIEGVLYELALLSHAGLRAKAPEPPQEEANTADDSCVPQILLLHARALRKLRAEAAESQSVTHLPSGESWAVQRRLTEWLRLEERMSRECGKAMRHASVLRSCVGSRRSGILRDAPRRQMDRLQARLSEMLSDETLKSSAALQDFLGVQAPEMPSSVRIVNLIQGDEAQVHLEVHTCDDTELAQAMATHVDATVLLLSQSTGVEDVELESFRVPAASPATVAIAGLQPSNMYEFQVRAANSVGSSASVCIRILVPENADCETGIAASTVPAPAAPEAAHALERQSDDEGVATSASPVLSAPEAAKALGRQSDDEGVAPAATLAPALAAPEAEAAPRALQWQADEGAGVAPAAALAPALAAPEAEAAPRALQRQADEGRFSGRLMRVQASGAVLLLPPHWLPRLQLQRRKQRQERFSSRLMRVQVLLLPPRWLPRLQLQRRKQRQERFSGRLMRVQVLLLPPRWLPRLQLQRWKQRQERFSGRLMRVQVLLLPPRWLPRLQLQRRKQRQERFSGRLMRVQVLLLPPHWLPRLRLQRQKQRQELFSDRLMRVQVLLLPPRWLPRLQLQRRKQRQERFSGRLMRVQAGVAPAATLAPALAAPEAEAAPRALQRQADEGAGVAPAAALAPALAAPEAEAAPRALQRQAGEGAGAASSAAPALAAPEEVQALARPLGDEGVAPAATLASALAVPDQQQTAQGAGITTVPIAETKAAAKSREEGQLKLKQPSPGYARIGSIEVRVSQLPENKAPGEALDALVLLQERYEISEQAALRLFLGCNFDLQEAIRRYDGILEWRKLHRADELRQELISQLQSCKELKPSFQQEVGKLVTVNPCALMTTDGSPVTLYHVGTAQAAAAGKARDDQLQRWGVFTSEYIDLWLTHQTAASGRLAGHVQIYDLHNVSFWQVSSGALVEKFRVLLGAGQNYMEQVSHIFVIRSGSIFTMAWKFVKGWVSPRTASKIHVSSDIPRELLELLGPGSALPGLLQSPQWSAPVLRPLAVSPA
ncbi:unnamed protein product [Effrenium voratum]|uniref:CRAL-TRIO domain-containing protein n=1 Tax=Effrenium voratum TaxID=2562239 RepID=A0AA36NB43_9DINO|nr:unnamed protein product [Effrenium voratum]